MTNSARHVLKGSEVHLAGSLQLHTSQVAPPGLAGSQPDAKPVRVRVAETHPDFAVLEVVCSCGKLTYVRCEYTTANNSAALTDSVQG